MPTLGRHGIRCGLSLSQSSVWTYSAVARVSRSASTTSLRVQRWVENADSGHPSCIAEHDTPAVPLGIDHLVLDALPRRPFRAENGVVVARRCRRSLVPSGRHLVGTGSCALGPSVLPSSTRTR